jgi:hypothetical protein
LVDRPVSCLDELHCSERDAAEADGMAGERDLSVAAEDGHKAFGVVIHAPWTWEASGEEVAGGSDTGSRDQMLVAPDRSLIEVVGEEVEMGSR